MQSANIKLETLTCPSCLQKINNSLKRLNGVDKDSVNVMFNSSRVKLNFNDNLVSIDNIVQAITNLGYNVINNTVKPV